MLPTKFQVNWPLGLGEEAKKWFSRWPPGPPSWISDQPGFSYFWSTNHPDASYQVWSQLAFRLRRRCKQEAHGPRFAHLSDIATADMQMLCNIFPILSSQRMKISSFEQFLVLKKNIWAWQSMEHDHLNKLSITFQQKDQCEIWWKLAKWFLKNRDFIHVNSTVAGKYYKYKPDDGHLRFPIRTILTTVDLQVNTFNINVYGPHK